MRDVTFADLQEAAGLGRKLDVDTSSVRLLREIARLRAGLAEIASSLPAHADGAACYQDKGYRCKCDIADVQRLIVDLLKDPPP